MKPIRLITGLSFAALAACVTQAVPPEPSSPASLIVLSDAELTTQRLAPGECGLFLWNRNASNRFIFFSRAGSGNAVFMFNDIARNLSQTGIGGEIFGQFLTEMSYEDATAGLFVTVTIEPGKPIDGGQKVRAGKIMVKDEAGWEVILPVAGTRACIDGN